jgi:AcrR family transcriptional regulator
LHSGAFVETNNRIFLAAERLFADFGFEGVSVREIVQAADVNLAAVSYHFGSKSELYLTLFRKRLRELTAERALLLRPAEAETADAPSVEAISRRRSCGAPRGAQRRSRHVSSYAPSPRRAANCWRSWRATSVRSSVFAAHWSARYRSSA